MKKAGFLFFSIYTYSALAVTREGIPVRTWDLPLPDNATDISTVKPVHSDLKEWCKIAAV